MSRRQSSGDDHVMTLVDKACAGQIGRVDMMSPEGQHIVVISFDFEHLDEAIQAINAIVKERDG